MKYNLLRFSKDLPQLGIIDGLDIASFDEFPVNFEEKRKRLKEQVEAEEFWAGRSLATRNSTRRAA
jgi:hypothetical protein